MTQLSEVPLLKTCQRQYDLTQDLPMPDWFKSQRQQAWQTFNTQGLPTTRTESWKYTQLRALSHKNFNEGELITNNNSASHEIDLFSMLEPDIHRLVLIDGEFDNDVSLSHKLPKGVEVKDWSAALDSHEALIKQYLGQAVDFNEHPFASLAAAIAHQGVVIIVPDNVIVEQPLHILIASSQDSHQTVKHLRHLIILGENAKLDIIEHYVDLHDVSYFNNVLTEVYLSANAKLSHYKIEQESHQAFHIGGIHVQQQQASYFISNAVTLSGHFSRHDIVTEFTQPHTFCELNGLYLTNQKQHVDYHTLIKHQVPYCNSTECYKGILDGQSTSVFNGKVYVEKDAQKTLSSQANHNLLLSAQAQANSKPELEIYADDVKCAHGATMGQLDEEAMFYLLTRGIDEETARHMLISAFANEILAKMNLNSVQRYCQRFMEMSHYA